MHVVQVNQSIADYVSWNLLFRAIEEGSRDREFKSVLKSLYGEVSLILTIKYEDTKFQLLITKWHLCLMRDDTKVFIDRTDAVQYISYLDTHPEFSDVSRDIDMTDEYEMGAEIVIKESGLRAGKGLYLVIESILGVYLPASVDESVEILDTLYSDDDTKEVIIEERLYGEEVSLLAFCDGYTAVCLPPAQDYKRSHNDDQVSFSFFIMIQGMNTGYEYCL